MPDRIYYEVPTGMWWVPSRGVEHRAVLCSGLGVLQGPASASCSSTKQQPRRDFSSLCFAWATEMSLCDFCSTWSQAVLHLFSTLHECCPLQLFPRRVFSCSRELPNAGAPSWVWCHARQLSSLAPVAKFKYNSVAPAADHFRFRCVRGAFSCAFEWSWNVLCTFGDLENTVLVWECTNKVHAICIRCCWCIFMFCSPCVLLDFSEFPAFILVALFHNCLCIPASLCSLPMKVHRIIFGTHNSVFLGRKRPDRRAHCSALKAIWSFGVFGCFFHWWRWADNV